MLIHNYQLDRISTCSSKGGNQVLTGWNSAPKQPTSFVPHAKALSSSTVGMHLGTTLSVVAWDIASSPS